MPRPRIDMRKIREVLRLALGEELSRRQVSAASGVPLTTVTDYLRRAEAAGLKGPLPDDVDDAALERCCIRGHNPQRPGHNHQPMAHYEQHKDSEGGEQRGLPHSQRRPLRGLRPARSKTPDWVIEIAGMLSQRQRSDPPPDVPVRWKAVSGHH
jgi:hypothetical protein